MLVWFSVGQKLLFRSSDYQPFFTRRSSLLLAVLLTRETALVRVTPIFKKQKKSWKRIILRRARPSPSWSRPRCLRLCSTFTRRRRSSCFSQSVSATFLFLLHHERIAESVSQFPLWSQGWTKVGQVESAGGSSAPSTLLNVGHHDSGISMGSPISEVQSVDRNHVPSTSVPDFEPASPPQEAPYHLATSSPNPPDARDMPAAPSESATSVKTENMSEIWNPQNSNPPQERRLDNIILQYY